jgi:ribonucleotide reductase alpha subunit
MQVLKRDGRLEAVHFDKITNRLQKLQSMDPAVSGADVSRVAQHVCAAIHDGISTVALDHASADAAIALATDHPDYSTLAARILVSNLQKTTSGNLYDVYSRLRHVVSDDFWDIVCENTHELNEMLDFDRDYKFDYFGFKTLQKAYLYDGERPQHMYMRVAIGIWGSDIARVKETYDALSTHRFTHASPTLFNAGTKTPQLCSCFLLGVHEDSLDSIFETLHKSASISKYGGGLGMHVSPIRSKGSLIKSTNGTSDGLVPMLKVANETFNYVNQCFVPETLVYTRDNGIQRMDCVKIGDHLVTRDGTFKRVNEVFKRYVTDEPMVTLIPEFKTNGITCTRVHEIFALRKGHEMPGFCPAAELEVGDRLAYPIPKDVVDYPFDVEFCRAYGKALAGGVKTFQKFVETNEEFRTDDPAPFFDPRFLNLPRPKTLSLLYGLLEKCDLEPEYISLDVPVNLVPHIRYLCLRLGILIRESDGVLKIPKHKISCIEPEGILYTPLVSVDKSVYTGEVYDFNMESNHNYTTDCGLVHNSGKRKGSCAIYIEPHHADIMSVLDLKRNQGDEHLRARDLFYAMWISDVFMERVETNASWSLFDPGTAPGLEDVWGDEYRRLYEKYEAEGRAIRTIPAHDLWFQILRSQIETGVPYMLYKDAANRKSNQRNLGTIKSSNLCVAPETLVLTSQGYRRIAELCGKDVSVWNGEEWSSVVVKKTNDDAELIKVTMNNGLSIECTRYHKFYLTGNGDPVRAENLKIGDMLAEWTSPIRDVHGTLEWLAGVVDASGWTCAGSICIPADIITMPESLLEDIRLTLLEFGVYSRIEDADLVIPDHSVATLVSLGFKPKRLILAPSFGIEKMVVVDVQFTGRRDATYCFDEPKRHMGVFNGILTGNCSEIIEFTGPDEIAVCTLGSISLPAFCAVDGKYDYNKLHETVKIVTRNLNRVIDITYYPVPEARRSNMRHRPIGLGVQGLADVFFLLKIPFDSPEAADINRKIFATIYHAAVETSCDICDIDGPYETFDGSPASRGQLQFDLWDAAPDPMYDWDALKNRAARGMRNSLLVAPMPTASTAQILGNTEAFEPITSNLYSRTTLAGTFTVVNRYLLRDLIDRGLWTPALKNQLVAAEGSVQNLDIPDRLKALYKTAYELSMKTVIDMAADRGIYVDQSMSLNMFVAEPTFRKLSSMHFYGWKKGLKTGMYYLRSKAASGAKKITVEPPECLSCSG